MRIAFSNASLDAALADPQLLAAFSFGEDSSTDTQDPRHLAVALPSYGKAPLECWYVDGNISTGRTQGIAWSEGGGLQFAAMEIPDAGDIEVTTAYAYQRLQQWLATSDYASVLRIWNYVDGITQGEGDAERYRRFCVGRAAGIGRAQPPEELPAATAIGHPQHTGRLQLYWLAARSTGTPLENPRQVQAWRYPRQYGPQPPGFARALLPPSLHMPLLLSGTAAVVGHASQHHDSLADQCSEVLNNLRQLLSTARLQRPELSNAFGAGTHLKVYVRDAQHLAAVDALLGEQLPDVPRIVLHGHICRRELLVEIDGSHW